MVLASLKPPLAKTKWKTIRECNESRGSVLQSQYDELEAKFLEEQVELEAKYHKLYEPLYTKMYEIVNGVVEVEDITNEVIPEGENKAPEE
ncbi:unnamed protein product [Lupinus luteus]|uniref:Uncharacterized protein n=1 Tax=Lupinus luteus TaxID=3873 RepID=A0AAV1XT80_LUPLU